MKITRRGALAIFLIFLAILLGITTDTGFSLGDKLLTRIGISPWTNGNSGFHISIVIWFVLFLIGILEAKRVMSGLQIFLLVLFICLLSPLVLSSYIKPIYFGMQSGLAAVEYDSSNTHFRYKNSEDGKNLKLLGEVALTNYGDTPLYLSIKIPSGRFEEWSLESAGDLVLKGVEDSSRPGMFVLNPGKKEILLSYTTIPLQSNVNGQGSMQGIDLILSTDKETRLVGR